MDLLFFTHLFNGLLMVALPVGLAMFLTRRFHLGWRLWWIGAATFVLSQVGHIPFNAIFTRLFASGALPKPPAAYNLIFSAVFLGLSAGLFEELARAAVLRWWADDARSWRKGVLFGAGHGGAEAIILGLLVLYTFANMVAMRGADIARFVAPAQLALAQQQVNAYWSASWPLSLLGAVERIFTIPFQIALAVLVLQAFTRKQPAWVLLAVFYHAVVDASLVYFAALWRPFAWGTYAAEGIIAAAALVSIAIIFALRRPEPVEETDERAAPARANTPPARISEIVKGEVKETEENLDQSRYV